MLRPYIVGVISKGTSGTVQQRPVTLAVPTGYQAGDLIVFAVRGQSTTNDADWNYEANGFTKYSPVQAPIPSSQRMMGIAGRRVTANETLPSSFTFTYTTGQGRQMAYLFIVRNVNATNPVKSANPTYVVPASGLGIAFTSITTTDIGLTIALAGNELTSGNSGPTAGSTTTGWTELARNQSTEVSTDSRTQAILYTHESTGVNTPQLTVLWTSAGGPNGAMVSFNPAEEAVVTPPPPARFGLAGFMRLANGTTVVGDLFYFDGTTKHTVAPPKVLYPVWTVDKWLDPKNAPWFMAHRGGSQNYPEMTAYAYRSAADWGVPALEISTVQSSEGVFIASHDATLDRVCQLTGWTISAHTAAENLAQTVKAAVVPLNKLQPDQPVVRIEQILDLYYKTHVIMVEVKQGNLTQMLDLLDTYGTVDRPANQIFVIKMSVSINGAGYTSSKARGYKTWAYIFNSAMADIETYASMQPSMIGMDHNSSDVTLTAGIDACLRYGVLPTAHILSTAAQRDRMIALGMKGLQCSDILTVAPPWLTRR